MATYYGPAPPTIAYESRAQLGRVGRPSAPSVAASISGIMRFKNAVYYPNYRVYRGETPASLNYSCISHVFYAFAHVSPNGAVLLSDEWADLRMSVDGSKGCLGSFMRLKEKHEHLQLVLSIGGGASSHNFASVAASAATRDTFARSAKGLVEASGFDGIDVDWEHPSTPDEGQNFLTLLALIRMYLPSSRYLLTAALPAGKWALQNIDLAAAQEYLDFVNLMAYDFAGPWSQYSGHHAQLLPGTDGEPSGSAAVEYVASSGFPAQRILLGVPVYGRSFQGVTGPGQPVTSYGGEDGTFEYKQLPRPETDEVVNTNVGAAFCVGGDGGFVSYDNPETVKMKANFCKEKGLGGLFYWTGTADVPPGPRSLISAGFKTLHDL